MNEHIPYRPSCGLEGADFYAKWCSECRHDINDSCGILANSFVYEISDPRYPVEWREDGPSGPRCTAFEPIDVADHPIDHDAVVRPLI
jgi:hypothetical protein